ncbi:hypothetical protein M422DRAFT_54820 [Sphaerobolus stellatus SS14]|uniref:Non-specific serine/threonine protein kinase n=1 Tax=Sphaerobolus stellatus (strain SS14) TaxID=990650 RepID=A0A0C9TF93_SPHS4|nr:hypothetical protein M422DRAFT_54820 [Sphaerobolus stellatus SS14]
MWSNTTSLLLITSLLVLFTQFAYIEDFSNIFLGCLTNRGRSKYSVLWPANSKLSAPSLSAQIPEELELLDIVVAASMDGKLHGLKRKTGRVLWSMKEVPETSTTNTLPNAFDSLVRTDHHSICDSELFIIEPQSGEIYLLPPKAAPSDPLQRLPLSIQQLVEMSPFSFPGDEGRVFVGRKETVMMMVELETGKVKRMFNSDKEFSAEQEENEQDGLDGTKPPKYYSKDRNIQIERTN